MHLFQLKKNKFSRQGLYIQFLQKSELNSRTNLIKIHFICFSKVIKYFLVLKTMKLKFMLLNKIASCAEYILGKVMLIGAGKQPYSTSVY